MVKSSLEQIKLALEKQAGTLPLAVHATDIVPGEGNSQAQIMFIGEAPGYHESVQRRPFVGKSGQLFRKILKTEAGIDPAEVYISNIVKARPPDNRDPSSVEIAAYRPYLDEEIECIRPLLIATLGRFSMAKFLPDVKVSQVHGRLHTVKWKGRRLFVLPMYHPAAALRSGQMLKSFTEDFKKLPKTLEWIKQKQQEYQLTDQVEALLF